MTAPQKVITASEPWAEYQLEDGTLLRFRLTACNFRKTGKTTDQGDPEYSFSHQMQCETIPSPAADKLVLISNAQSDYKAALNASMQNAAYSAPVEDAG